MTSNRTRRTCITLCAITAFACFNATTASAAVVNAVETIDLLGGPPAYFPASGIVVQDIVLAVPVPIGIGDFVDMTIHFAPGQAIQMGDHNELIDAWFAQAADIPNPFTIENVEMELLGFQGSTGTSSTLSIASYTSGVGIVGPRFTSFLSPGQTIQFNGLHVTYDVTVVVVDPDNYSSIRLAFLGDSVSLVPEPTTFGTVLMMSGLAAIGSFARRKRDRPSVASRV